jgi:hypothetical protein
LGIEPIGVLTVAVGVVCLLLGYRAAFATFVFAALFGSAAAILVSSANIQPAHLLLVFAALTIFASPYRTSEALKSVRFPEPGFWLICLVVYGVVSAAIAPRLLAGMTPIVPLGTSQYADTGSTVPLGPVSSNLTQSIYLLADLLCFMMASAIASKREGLVDLADFLLAYAVGNTLFALLDVGTYATGTEWLLQFMRNARYVLHLDEEVSGLKRIVGSFPEASAFARSTLGVLGFTGTLALCGRRPALTITLAIASFFLVVLSTSSTGLAGTPLVVLILYGTAAVRSGFHPNHPYRSAAVLCAPLLALAGILALSLNDGASETVRAYLDLLIFNKSTSDSATLRAFGNASAMQNFFDSYWLGVGLGTVRVSSLPVAVLSNVGLPGAAFYLLFVGSALARAGGAARTLEADLRVAARNGCLGLIAGDIVASSTVEQGLLFYVLAAVVCAVPERKTDVLAPEALLTGVRE